MPAVSVLDPTSAPLPSRALITTAVSLRIGHADDPAGADRVFPLPLMLFTSPGPLVCVPL